jgi:hypothetical protein
MGSKRRFNPNPKSFRSFARANPAAHVFFAFSPPVR